MVFEELNIEEKDDMKEETFETHISKKKEKQNTAAVHISRKKSAHKQQEADKVSVIDNELANQRDLIQNHQPVNDMREAEVANENNIAYQQPDHNPVFEKIKKDQE